MPVTNTFDNHVVLSCGTRYNLWISYVDKELYYITVCFVHDCWLCSVQVTYYHGNSRWAGEVHSTLVTMGVEYAGRLWTVYNGETHTRAQTDTDHERVYRLGEHVAHIPPDWEACQRTHGITLVGEPHPAYLSALETVRVLLSSRRIPRSSEKVQCFLTEGLC